MEFYQWLHMQLAHMVTYQQATTLSIGRVVQLVSQRIPRERAEHLTALYGRIKGRLTLASGWVWSQRGHCERLPYRSFLV